MLNYGKITLYLGFKVMKKSSKVTKKQIEAAVAQSSRMEGLSLHRAKKNKAAIKLLQQYGRAFSL